MSKEQLLLTCFLAVIVVYLHAVFAFYFVDDTYYNEGYGPEGERTCVSLMQCFLTTVNYVSFLVNVCWVNPLSRDQGTIPQLDTPLWE